MLRWGLVPFWAKELKIGNRMINARSETVFEKPAFRNAAKSKRCAIVCDGFYEWKPVKGQKKKQPYLIAREDREPWLVAGCGKVGAIRKGQKTGLVSKPAPSSQRQPTTSWLTCMIACR
ncbi:Putative SOS response-associated peptidase YedK [Mariniblastus fucicola]|uniref:Abasic site processing protein n=1 Tax=Mariniblastus fucicola TaxID=980251 RepID=A0A5B9PSA3_9BACT|nr:Putative SOS response-associated peptidase YedK [Mariniblastus fucicola]